MEDVETEVEVELDLFEGLMLTRFDEAIWEVQQQVYHLLVRVLVVLEGLGAHQCDIHLCDNIITWSY